MKTLIIAEFPAMKGKLEELEALLRAALPDTRAFDGCISIETYLHRETETFTLIEYWESPEHYQRYLDWRIENGLGELLDDVLDGGMAGFNPRTFVATDIQRFGGADNFVELKVADNWPGLSREVHEHLFSVFSSSKEDGLGIGLSICRTIIEVHGGKISASASEEGGALFTFTLQKATERG